MLSYTVTNPALSRNSHQLVSSRYIVASNSHNARSFVHFAWDEDCGHAALLADRPGPNSGSAGLDPKHCRSDGELTRLSSVEHTNGRGEAARQAQLCGKLLVPERDRGARPSHPTAARGVLVSQISMYMYQRHWSHPTTTIAFGRSRTGLTECQFFWCLFERRFRRGGSDRK
jgi:hypothetical protein